MTPVKCTTRAASGNASADDPGGGGWYRVRGAEQWAPPWHGGIGGAACAGMRISHLVDPFLLFPRPSWAFGTSPTLDRPRPGKKRVRPNQAHILDKVD
ncbi:hypothetical protein GUJ93_ZPchr0008g12405 [Zizania palustris]|uniref:Uncharacterized protein n=1 Tax=Zizania palustris TaxID=103762 RepID=A0A8J5R7Y7_ZIZPA|nr:hypothetical protein GUJ93_ZPchr0008g12405 [Zizania palustris]